MGGSYDAAKHLRKGAGSYGCRLASASLTWRQNGASASAIWAVSSSSAQRRLACGSLAHHWNPGRFSIRLRITPEITDPLPQDIAEIFARLGAALDETIPPRHLDRNLLVATWNIRAFGRVTEKWRSE